MVEFIRYLTPLGEPLGLLWLALWAGAVGFAWRKQRNAGLYCAALALVLWVLGASPLAPRLIASLERPYATEDWTQLPAADAVVMLGGTHHASKFDINGVGLAPAADRVVTAWGLIRLHRARALVFGGGGYSSNGVEVLDARMLQDWFARWQLVGVPMHDLGLCRNTHDEALATAALMKRHGWKSILLVTSASHMHRAAAVFRKQGIRFHPVAADFQVVGVPEPPGTRQMFPRVERLHQLTMYLHELLGYWAYRQRGWVE